ncbi:Mitogen-activated protein kinase kinase kinase 5, putative isoform 2 [Hibiscus syriacus]|uniref:mitogen-activated protein kinase kinase kinase n=1 Tax=Hibiscus syriacus TaxID=106335 RepID=A0A6A3CF33_HIBSY|nr:mitogen-activated protein kinase kinase kinase 5-like [Hibiscus syriacus]KAE8727965.1 Mitogen-activated protein kinase kinase kinase 5, putative isoform 2 [Hibiscus syriacus]
MTTTNSKKHASLVPAFLSMPISRKKFSLLSSSLPSSRSHLHDNAGKAGNSCNNQAQQKRCLTRQRRFRHLTDDEVGLRFGDIHSSLSSPCSHDTPAGKDSGSPERLDHWSSYAEPKPLPLPEVFLNRKSTTSGSSPGPSKLASPDERLATAVGRKNADHAAKSTPSSLANVHKEFSQGESFKNGSKPTVTTRNDVKSFPSSPASPQRSNTQDHLNSYDDAVSTKSLLSRRRNFPYEKDFGSVNHNLRLNVSARSAPTTVFSSPSVSPQRSRGSIDLDVPYLGRASGYASPLRTVHSPECSPLHIPGQNKTSSHHKLLLENNKDWLDNNSELNAHPLPLPPEAFQSSQSLKPLPSSVPNHIIERPIAPSIISQWKKGRLLGRGTHGSVYEATNRATGALCAMKEVDIIPDDPKSVECVKQLEQEIRVLRRLKHRNIVQYYGSELVDDHFYIYLEYVHPGSINKYVREHSGAITEPIVRNFTRHILSGLAFLHSSNTIHRDIKGANLLVDANGTVKLADFGMAKHLTGLSDELSLKGSPYWMAPEVLKSVMKKDSNPNLALAVDIWSLGCTVIEMLNGKPPWSDFEGPRALFKVLNQNPTVPEALSPEGKDFLHCCFQRNPAERPSAAMLLEHPFVRNSVNQNGPALVQAFSRMNLTDNSHSQRIEMMSTSPGTRITKGKSPSNSVTGLSGCARTNNCATASHHLLYSALEVSPYTSAARVIYGSHSFSPSSHVSSNMSLGEVNNHPLAVGRTQGKEVPHI